MRHGRIILTIIFAIIVGGNCLSNYENNEIDSNSKIESRDTDLGEFRKDDPSERFIFGTGNLGTTGTTSVTIGNAGYLVLGAYILIPLIIGLALLFYLIGGAGQGGHSGGYHAPVESYGHTGGSTYGSYARSFDPYAIDWEKFNIIDWISIGEEAWRKFNPSDLDCQKRLICEIHQNTSKFGAAAARMVDLFSYLQYAEVLSLPDEFKSLVEEYLDAADRGRSLQKDCGELYDSCDFSVKKMVDKYSHNEI